MIKLSQDSKVYVYCPEKSVTGGAELLHQLVHEINTLGFNAYIVYFDNDQDIPKEYSHYRIKTTTIIEDNSKNVLIAYEGVFNKVFKYREIKIVLWWLSVDNVYYSLVRYLSLRDFFKWDIVFGIKVFAYRVKKIVVDRENYFNNNFSLSMLKKINAFNFYQSEYAQHFLNNNRFDKCYALSDYINTDFYSENYVKQRNNTVLYNPKKGFKFTEKLIKITPDVKWVPLENLNREQLKKMFQESKLYIDFGFHPGKDRLPREAALNGCCVITGRKGSANYYEDVPVDSQYKFDETTASLLQIKEKITQVVNNYDNHCKNFNFYRQSILKEQSLFVRQVRSIFQLED